MCPTSWPRAGTRMAVHMTMPMSMPMLVPMRPRRMRVCERRAIRIGVRVCVRRAGTGASCAVIVAANRVAQSTQRLHHILNGGPAARVDLQARADERLQHREA